MKKSVQISILLNSLILIILIGIIILILIYYQKTTAYVRKFAENITKELPVTYEHNSINHIQFPKIIPNIFNNVDEILTFSSDISKIPNNKRKTNILALLNINNYKEILSYLIMCNLLCYYYYDKKIKNLKIIKNLCPFYMEYRTNIDKFGILYKIYKNKSYILSYRGTIYGEDILTDIDGFQVIFSDLDNKKYSKCLVHRGFYNTWYSFSHNITKNLYTLQKNSKIIITGHSLGSAYAAMTALSLALYSKRNNKNYNISLYMFAPPRVGNRDFVDLLNKYVKNNYSIINISDIITDLPPAVLFTFSESHNYSKFSNRIELDFNFGSARSNHSISNYLCAIKEDCSNFFDDNNIYWNDGILN